MYQDMSIEYKESESKSDVDDGQAAGGGGGGMLKDEGGMAGKPVSGGCG